MRYVTCTRCTGAGSRGMRATRGTNGPINSETYPGWARITFQFPARGDMPPVKFVWYEGKNESGRVLPPTELVKPEYNDFAI